MNRPSTEGRFEAFILPLLGPGYSLARWLTHDADEAQDVLQESALKAFRFFESLRSEDPRAWFLTIVRNTCYSSARSSRVRSNEMDFDEEAGHPDGFDVRNSQAATNPETRMVQQQELARVDRAILALPTVYREALVLKELEELSYREIAQITGVPVGTVMSRLARARDLLRSRLSTDPKKSNPRLVKVTHTGSCG